jgi:negative regulator of flagellin synthesis FlgM
MSVDFNGIGPGQVNNQRPSADKASGSQAPNQAGTEQAKSQAPNSARGENVNLSSQAKNLKQLEQKLADFPEMDDERIEQIRAALEDGSYKVDAQKLAQKMLEMDESIFG